MTTTVETGDAPAHGRRVAEMLGLAARFKSGMGSALAVHQVLRSGLPRRALLTAMQSMQAAGIPVPMLLPVFGISLRTFMRLKTEPDKLLDAEQSGRVWQFAELLANAEDVLGSAERAVDWMLSPAMALENCQPIELLTTPVGARLVDDILERMRYGVYQ